MVSCRPGGILSSREMRDVMVDLHKTDALLQTASVPYNNLEVRAIYYAQVLEKHGITQAEFDSSLVWYTAHPQLFDKIYPKVLKQLHAEEDAFLALHEAELGVMPAAGTEPSAYSREQLDSIVNVTLHGYPVQWCERPSPAVTVPYSL